MKSTANPTPLALEEKLLNGGEITPDEAVALLLDDSDLFTLLASSNRIRQKFKGSAISFCSIINARSGKCPENCSFCSQSAHNSARIAEYGLIEQEEMLDAAVKASSTGAAKFGIVTSGKGPGNREEFDRILETVEKIRDCGKIQPCASLGILSKEELLALKRAGMKEYHHNLETARSFFPEICTSHSYDENVATVRAAKEAGLRTCCGGIFGMGESIEQRVELAVTLRELDVDTIPINFLNPVTGTKMEGRSLLNPREALKIIAVYRFMLPEKDIKVAGGREVVLRDLQCLMFAAGANSTMLGNYLTTKGRDAQDDIRMIEDLGLRVGNLKYSP